MGSRSHKIETSFTRAYENLQSDVEAFGVDIREIADSMVERDPDADRTQMYETAADELENIVFLDMLSGDFDDVAYVIDDLKNISKVARLGNLIAAGEALLAQVQLAVDQPSAGEDDTYGDDLREFLDELSNILVILSSIEL